MTSTDFNPADKKDVILDAALELFSEHGFDATTVRMIADKAGVNVAMISYYFGSKDKMFEELIIRKTNYMRGQLNSLVENTEMNPWQKVEALIDSYSDRILTSGGGFHRLLVRELSLRQRKEMTQMIESRFTYNLNAFRTILLEGVEQKMYHEEIDIPMLMNMMIGTITQAAMSSNVFCKMIELDNETAKPEGIPTNDIVRQRVKTHLKRVFARYLLIEPQKYFSN